MKKIVLKMVVAIVVAFGVVLGISNTQKSQQTNDLLKENIEAFVWESVVLIVLFLQIK